MEPVLLIESPGLLEITTGDRRGEVLSRQLHMLRVPCVYAPIHTNNLVAARMDTMKPYSVMHLAAHGLKGSIGFTDGSALSPEQLRQVVWPRASDRIVVLDACDTHWIQADDPLSALLRPWQGGPKCVLTMVGKVFFADSALSWSVFYRHLFARLGSGGVPACTARDVLESLKRVKAAELGAPICAAYWYEAHSRWVDISPWKPSAENNVSGMGL